MTVPAVLVTGGAGYVGSHTCKELARAGYTPITLDNLVYGHKWAVKWGPLVVGDIKDREKLDYVLKTYRPQSVLHFAAFAYVGESIEDPGKYYQNNVSGTISLLNAMQNYGCRQIVFSSSCATYGVPETIPIPEMHPQRPINPYGWSKLMIEQILRDYHQSYGLRSVSLRYFNAAGADPQGDLGELHDPETHLIPNIFRAALHPSQPIEIYGDDYDTEDGTCVRDFIHVSDLARAHILALKNLEENQQCIAFNLGNGRGFSVKQVVDAARKIAQRKIAIEIKPPRPGDPPVLIGDASTACRILGWKQHFSDLEAILETAWEWQKKHTTVEDGAGLSHDGVE